MDWIRTVRETLELPSGQGWFPDITHIREVMGFMFADVAAVTANPAEKRANVAFLSQMGIYNISFYRRVRASEEEVGGDPAVDTKDGPKQVEVACCISDSIGLMKDTTVHMDLGMIEDNRARCAREASEKASNLELLGDFRGEELFNSGMPGTGTYETMALELKNPYSRLYRSPVERDLMLLISPDGGWMMPELHILSKGGGHSGATTILESSGLVNGLSISPGMHRRFISCFDYKYDRLSEETFRILSEHYRRILWPRDKLAALVMTTTNFYAAVQFKNGNMKFAVFNPHDSTRQLATTYCLVDAMTFRSKWDDAMTGAAALAEWKKDPKLMQTDDSRSGRYYYRRGPGQEWSNSSRHPSLCTDARYYGTHEGLTEEEFTGRINILAAANKL